MMKSKSAVLLPLLLMALIAILALVVGCEGPSEPSPLTPCKRPKVLAFTASWCGPCRHAKPALVRIQARGVDVQIIDIDERPDLARQYGITSVPTFLVYVCGREPVRTNDVSVVVTLTHF